MGLDSLEYPNLFNHTEETARKILKNKSIENYRVLYKDYKGASGRVLEQKIDKRGVLNVYVSARSIIKNLPGNFQNNESLKNFLMIFQHFNNSFNRKLDSLSDHFNPMVTDRKFLFWLSSWFSLESGSDLPEDRYRKLVREIVTLYRWRGTKRGLERILEIISGCRPTIVEGNTLKDIYDEESISFTFTEADSDKNQISIVFPKSQKELGGSVVKTIFNIVDKEKPAHIQCNIGFAPDREKEKRSVFEIGEAVLMDDSRL